MTRRALLVVNAKSRTGRDSLDEISGRLRVLGIEPVHHDCGGRDALSGLIAREAGSVDLVVVAGGDGTLNAAAGGLIAAKKPLGLIPTETANDLARTLGVEPTVAAAMDVIAAGHTRTIDLGLVNDVPFFNVASIGLSVELAQALTSDLKRRFGKLGYAIAAVKTLARAKPFHARIVGPEGHVRPLTYQVAVGNGRFYGGGALVEANAEIDNGRLVLYSLEATRAWRMVLMLRSIRTGDHGSWKEIRSMSGETFEIRTHRPRKVNADGEIVTETPARFSVLPKALEVFAPPKPQRPART